MSSNYNAIHFDMDGVIVDTEAFHVAAEQQTCRDYGFAIDPTEWSGFKGRKADDIFKYLIATYGDSSVHSAEQLIAHKTDVFLESITGKDLAIDGVLTFLDWARSTHPRMALVTSSNQKIQRHITSSLGIDDLFDTVVNGDDVQEGKPSPKPYLLSLGRLGVNGIQSVVIEDSRSGILSAQRADCDVLAITMSHSRSELRRSQPTFIVDSYEQARAKLEVA